jgi:hypothetical protein
MPERKLPTPKMELAYLGRFTKDDKPALAGVFAKLRFTGYGDTAGEMFEVLVPMYQFQFEQAMLVVENEDLKRTIANAKS